MASRFQGAASLSTREGACMLYLQRCEAPQSFLSVNLRVGSEVPIITSGTGWAYLAGLAPDARRMALAECKQAHPALYKAHEKQVLAALADYTKDGFVTNIDIFFPGMSTVSVPLGTEEHHSPYALNITSASAVFKTAASRAQAGDAMVKIAARLRPVADRLRGG
ncbi:MAG: hypothetical protein EON93_22085 [Burkholderiales bacterium]|nr:MAG: hypothetical protein EON93_22085 [Burkholderiales bacterium]